MHFQESMQIRKSKDFVLIMLNLKFKMSNCIEILKSDKLYLEKCIIKIHQHFFTNHDEK